MRRILHISPVALTAGSVLLGAVTACTAAQSATRPPAAHVSRMDQDWVARAHLSDMAEMETGPQAVAKGGSQAIRSAGAMLVRDHTAFDQKLTQAAVKLRIQLPASLTPPLVETGDRLSNQSGPTFDHDFTGTMLAAHQAMIAATRQEIAHGSSPVVRALARQALPVLIKHYQMLQKAAPTG